MPNRTSDSLQRTTEHLLFVGSGQAKLRGATEKWNLRSGVRPGRVVQRTSRSWPVDSLEESTTSMHSSYLVAKTHPGIGQRALFPSLYKQTRHGGKVFVFVPDNCSNLNACEIFFGPGELDLHDFCGPGSKSCQKQAWTEHKKAEIVHRDSFLCAESTHGTFVVQLLWFTVAFSLQDVFRLLHQEHHSFVDLAEEDVKVGLPA